MARETVKDLRRKLGLPDLTRKEMVKYWRLRRKQNDVRTGFGMPPLPLVLAELRQRMSDARVEAFLSQHAPRENGHRDTPSFSGCPAYDAAIAGPGTGEADFQPSSPKP